jgi:hypothetical protein
LNNYGNEANKGVNTGGRKNKYRVRFQTLEAVQGYLTMSLCDDFFTYKFENIYFIASVCMFKFSQHDGPCSHFFNFKTDRSDKINILQSF